MLHIISYLYLFLESDQQNVRTRIFSPNPHQHFPARRNPQFAVNAFDMVAYGVVAQVDCFGDFAGGDALVNQQGDFEFALGQVFSLELAEDFTDGVCDAR